MPILTIHRYHELERNGNPAPNPEDETDKCNLCTPTRAEVVIEDLTFPTLQGARAPWSVPPIRDATRKFLIDTAWGIAWNDFECTNQKCPKKEACGNQPTFYVISIAEVDWQNVAGGPILGILFKYHITLEREIRCIEGDAPDSEDTPSVIEPPRGEEEAEGSLEPDSARAQTAQLRYGENVTAIKYRRRVIEEWVIVKDSDPGGIFGLRLKAPPRKSGASAI